MHLSCANIGLASANVARLLVTLAPRLAPCVWPPFRRAVFAGVVTCRRHGRKSFAVTGKVANCDDARVDPRSPAEPWPGASTAAVADRALAAMRSSCRKESRETLGSTGDSYLEVATRGERYPP
jgi:hypothetical protein